MEAALRETDARLREAQRIARLGSWSWEHPQIAFGGPTPSSSCLVWSDGSSSEFRSVSQLTSSDDRVTAIDRVNALLAGASEFANDLRVVRPDGTLIWFTVKPGDRDSQVSYCELKEPIKTSPPDDWREKLLRKRAQTSGRPSRLRSWDYRDQLRTSDG